MERGNILKCLQVLREMGLRRNELTGCLEKKEGDEWEPLKLATLWTKSSQKVDITFEDFCNVCGSDEVAPVVNPFKIYLEGLPPSKTDSDPFHELGLLVSLLRENNRNRKIMVNHIKKWFLAAVRSVYEKEFLNKNCLVFVGKEGIGKTPFLKSWIPKPLKNSLLNNPTQVELREGSCLRFSFLEEVGEWIDRCGGVYREFLSQPNIVSFLGCARDVSFLEKLKTSQFVCIEVMSIFNRAEIAKKRKELLGPYMSKKKPAEEFDIDTVWSKAFSLYKKGEPTEYTQEELSQIKKDNKTTFELDDGAKIVSRYLRPSNPLSKDAKHLTASSISDLLNEKQSDYKFNKYRVGKAMSKAGFIIKSKDLKRGYYVTFFD